MGGARPSAEGRPSAQLQNCSTLPIKFSMQLDSLSRSRSEDQPRLPQFLTSRAQRTEIVGEPGG